MKKRILFVSHHGDVIGGGELSLLDLMRHLDKNHFEPVLLVSKKGEVSEQARQSGIPSVEYNMPTLKGPHFFIFWLHLKNLKKICRELKPDLIHANGSRCMLYMGFVAQALNIPIVWHVRITEKDLLLDRLLYKKADKLIVISKSVQTRFKTYTSFNTKVRIIHNGIDLKLFNPETPSGLKTDLGLKAEEPVVGIIGRLVPFKGHFCFIQSAKLILKEKATVQFLIVGEGPLREELEKKVRKEKMETAFHFLGHRNDIKEILSILDLFVLASRLEHFGRVLIEAMAMAKPVVATNAGAVPEIAVENETALFVPPENPKKMAEAVLEILNSNSRAQEMGIKGRKRVEENFTIQKTASSVSELYRELLGKA